MPRTESLLLALVGLALAGAAGCGDEIENATSGSGPSTSAGPSGPGGSGATGGVGGVGGIGGVGPGGAGGLGGGGGATGGGGGCVTTDGLVLAVDKLFLGDTDTNGMVSANAWKQFGFDLDGKLSDSAATDLCQPSSGGMKGSVYPDGDNGIDNGWGKNLLPVFTGIAPDFSAETNAEIQNGERTLMLAFLGLGPEADKPAFTTKLYSGSSLGQLPKFDGSDCWPVVRELLDDPADIGSSKIVFPTSTLAGNAWSSTTTGTVEVVVASAGFPFTLTIHGARLAVQLDADHLGATQGMIGGVLDTEELVAEFKILAGSFSPDLCSGTTIDAIANQLRRASDIMKDGTQDPAATCDGISIGLGFEMKSVQLGGVAPPATPVDDPCAP